MKNTPLVQVNVFNKIIFGALFVPALLAGFLLAKTVSAAEDIDQKNETCNQAYPMNNGDTFAQGFTANQDNISAISLWFGALAYTDAQIEEIRLCEGEMVSPMFGGVWNEDWNCSAPGQRFLTSTTISPFLIPPGSWYGYWPWTKINLNHPIQLEPGKKYFFMIRGQWVDFCGYRNDECSSGGARSGYNAIDFSYQTWYDPDFVPESEEKRNPVIIVPGIIASYLNSSATGEELWPNFAKMSLPGPDAYLRDLMLNQFGDYDPANPIVSSTGIFREIGGMDFFNGLVEELGANGYEEGVDLFIFTYDWRMNIDKVAGQNPEFLMNNLDQEIFKIKMKTGAEKMDVVAHSMGGLVVKDYINIYGGENINKFIDIATPHLGSPGAFKMLYFGDDLGINLLNIFKLDINQAKYFSQNFPSIYQLLPSRKYFESDIPGILPTSGYIYDIAAGDQNVGVLSGLTYDQSIDYLAYTQDDKGETRNKYLLGEFGVNAVNVNDELHSRLDNMPISDSYYNIIGCG